MPIRILILVVLVLVLVVVVALHFKQCSVTKSQQGEDLQTEKFIHSYVHAYIQAQMLTFTQATYVNKWKYICKCTHKQQHAVKSKFREYGKKKEKRGKYVWIG